MEEFERESNERDALTGSIRDLAVRLKQLGLSPPSVDHLTNWSSYLSQLVPIAQSGNIYAARSLPPRRQRSLLRRLKRMLRRVPQRSRLTKDSRVVVQSSSLPASDKIYSLRTAKEIFSEFDNRTNMEADKILAAYIGKWLQVDDLVKNIFDHSDSIRVLVGRALEPGISLSFGKKLWQERLETMRIGDRLIAEGRIDRIDPLYIHLEGCEILEAIRPTKSP